MSNDRRRPDRPPETMEALLENARTKEAMGDTQGAIRLLINAVGMISQGTAIAMRDAEAGRNTMRLAAAGAKESMESFREAINDLRQRVTKLEDGASPNSKPKMEGPAL